MSDPTDPSHADPSHADTIRVTPITPADQEFVRAELIKHFISPLIRSLDHGYRADELPGYIARLGGERVGHITWAIIDDSLEIITLATTIDDRGVGTALLEAAGAEARRAGCTRMFLTTSNDNLRALAFYQKRGWRLVAVHRGMIDRYRERDREIPLIGLNGIPMHDEIELERQPM